MRAGFYAPIPAALIASALVLAACDSQTSTPSTAFSYPIDFAYACEGDGKTVAPTNDETAAQLSQTRMCPDLVQVVDGAPQTVQGDLFGVVLDRQPAQLMVLQLNPASGTRRFIDADFFVPGVNGIPVGTAPVRVLTAPDWSAFYVLSAGAQRVDRVVIHSLVGEVLAWSASSFDLPGAPIDGTIIGQSLVVVPQTRAELWVHDLAASAATPPRVVLPLPDRPLRVEPLVSGDGRMLVTFRSRPTVAVVDLSGAIVAEAGLVPACRDGLDNDGDGLSDALDPDCHDRDDDDESDASGAERITRPTPAPAFVGAPACDNGVDDDGDGYTDYPADPACASADDDGELLPECDDGIDNDGDGLTDLEDESCYSPYQLKEGQAPIEGPFHPTLVDGGESGRFVYVADERTGEIAVFSWDGAALVRVDVNAADATPPSLASVPFGSSGAEPTESVAVPATRSPALARQGIKNILITETNVSHLSSGRLRGELWDRIIEAAGGPASVSLSPNSAEWKPARCAASPTDRCYQPELDDATWYAFGPNLEGRIQLIEAIRRGTPVHRLAQRTTDLSLRTHDITAPRLSLRGRLINARGEPQLRLPFIGAALEEELVARVNTVSPARFRRFGLWPPADLETALNESWALTYEGIIPRAAGRLGSFSDEASFVDPNARFCELGVQVGDWLQLVVPVSGTDPSLVHEVAVTLADGRVCPTQPITSAMIEIPIAEVGMSSLGLDTSEVRLRPNRPALDTDAIAAQGLSRRLCEEALTALDDRLGLPANLVTSSGFATSKLPAGLTWNVRAAGWIANGTRSGFLHRNRWDRASATCGTDDSLDPRVAGRIAEVPDAATKYGTCPPSVDALRSGAVDQIADPARRFFNPSFGVDIFPACDRDAQGAIVPVPSQQDTVFTFTVTGPQQGSALSVTDSLLLTRVPLLDFRRQQVQLDTAARKASILQLRIGDPRVIATFE